MNPFEMVVLIVAIVMIAGVLKSRRRDRTDWDDGSRMLGENAELRDEVRQLKERIQVLERITVDKEHSLSREIDQLRDR